MKGHTRKRGNRWYAIYDLPRDPVTQRRRQRWESGFRTKRDADAALTEILTSLGRSTYVEPSKQTVADFLDEWFHASSSSRRASTNATYEVIIRTHLIPHIGSIRLQALSSPALNRLYSGLLEAGSSAATVRYVHAVISKALSDAVRWNLLARNVAQAADPPRLARRQIRTWSAREVRVFLQHVESDRLYAAYVLAATTGMRRGEVLGLRWLDVDLDQGRVSVSQTLVAVEGEVLVSEPKTARGRRNVPLDATTRSALREHRDRQRVERSAYGVAYVDEDLVFCREDGTPLHPDAFSDAFFRHAKAAGLQRIRLHDLRHTHATLALSAGVHPKVVSERLGHASVAFTLDTYSHAIPALQESAADLVASLVFDDDAVTSAACLGSSLDHHAETQKASGPMSGRGSGTSSARPTADSDPAEASLVFDELGRSGEAPTSAGHRGAP